MTRHEKRPILRWMRLLHLATAVVLLTGAVSLTGAVLTRDGVGAVEYLVAALLALLLVRAGLGAGRSGLAGRATAPASPSE